MKKITYSILVAALALVACKKTPEIVIPDDQKEKIAFSMNEDQNLLTRAGFIGSSTNIAARFISTNNSESRHTNTVLTAAKDNGNDVTDMSTFSTVSYPSNANIRYWDDAFGRAAFISVYAIAVPNKDNTLTNNGKNLENLLDNTGTVVDASNNPNWKTGSADKNTVSWQITKTAQTSELIANEDLCYTNNIQKSGAGEKGHDGRRVYGSHDATGYPDYSYDGDATDKYPTLDDGELQFKLVDSEKSEGPGHFDYGHMIFTHALSRISIDLYAGEGFDMTPLKDGEDNPTGPSPYFTFKSETNITLKNMPWKGDLDMKAGTWSNLNSADIQKMFSTDKHSKDINETNKATNPIYSLTAQVVPGYVISKTDDATNVMLFNVDDNEYYITQKQIFEALTKSGASLESHAGDASITMEQGKHYKFKITVNKTGIKSITCTLIDWVDIEALFDAKNAYITLNLLDPGSEDVEPCSKFDLYRILNTSSTISTPTNPGFSGTSQFMKGYAAGYFPSLGDKLSTEGLGAGITNNGETNQWKTTWYFESNKSFYHFRTVNPGMTINKDETNGDYFTMYSGRVNDTFGTLSSALNDGNYNDYHWGATFTSQTPSDSYTGLNYNTSTGFESRLMGPIGPTKSVISIVEQHMMSNIRVVLLTPSTGTDCVTLYDDSGERVVSTVSIINCAENAKVRMGNGHIEASETKSDMIMTTPTYTQEGPSSPNAIPGEDYLENASYVITDKGTYKKSYAYTYRVVPQSLTVGEPVGITIQTPDDNIYYVVSELSSIKPSSITGNSLKGDHKKTEAIDRWYPGYTYTYYFILTKTGIQALTCTIVDWVNVDAEPIDINLES